MHITTTTNGVALEKDLQEFIDLRLHFALGRFADIIDRVSIRIEDTNGPRGGIDKRCRIVVKLRGFQREQVTIDDHDTNSYAAVA
ncbi:MAG: hypothetical protein JW829_16840, partial [Pirellulales bacterium]|nr:hypothetical protein [Pirellulales bacterium]